MHMQFSKCVAAFVLTGVMLGNCAVAETDAGNQASDGSNHMSNKLYSYIEWIKLSGKEVPKYVENLVVKHLKEEYESARDFAVKQKAPMYMPIIEYALFDVNDDGHKDVFGQVYSGYLCGRHTGCPTVVLIKQPNGTYVESFNEKVQGRLGVTDTGMLAYESRDFEFYKCDLYRIDERGYFSLQDQVCDEE